MLVGGTIDVLMLQEHHLNERRCWSYSSILQGNWITHWSAGIGSYGSTARVCISINAKWKEELVHYNEVTQFGFLNIYAPNHVAKRIEFWSQLGNVLHNIDNWCVAGDFNMIESMSDRRGGGQSVIHGMS